MGIIYQGNKEDGLLAGYPVRKTFFKNDEVLHYDKINKQWIAKAIVAGGEFSGDMDDIANGTTYVKTENNYTDTEKTKLSGIQESANVNNISDEDATELTGGGETTLHSHAGAGGLTQPQIMARTLGC